MEVGSHIVVDEAFLFVHLFSLVPEDGIFIPTFGEGIGGVYQRVSF